MTTEASTRHYLSTVLQLEPSQNAAEILSYRRRYHRGLELVEQTPDSRVADAPMPNREALREAVEKLRQAFWSAKPQSFAAQAEQLDLSAYPDLREARNRLLRVNQLRHEFVELIGTRGVDQEFVNRFRKIVVASTRDATVMKEMMLASMRKSAHKSARKTIKIIRRRFRNLYELEVDWLESMTETKKAARTKVANTDYGFTTGEDGSSGLSMYIVIFLIIKALVLASRAFND